MRCRKARGFESRLRYMSKDRYEFINPAEGGWNSYEFSVRDVLNAEALTFDTEHWEIHQVITVVRKPEPIKAGQGWWDDRVDFETNSVEILGLIERDSVTYVAYMDYEGAAYLSNESYFRSNFHRNISE